MRYLLLGGSGFIGKHLAAALLARGDAVTIAGKSPSFNMQGAKYIQLDFVNCNDFSEYIKDIDVIVHLISTILPSDNLLNVNEEISANVFPTTTLLKNASDLQKEIVFISSGGTIYGESAKPCSEKTPTNPICNYGLSKLLIEKYLGLFNHIYDLKYKVVRLSNPYSEEIKHNKQQGVVPIIINNILNDEPVTIWGGDQTRDYIHIDDAVDGIISILDYHGSEYIFNIGSGIGYTIDDIIKMAEKKLHKKAKLIYLPTRKCDVKNNILDIKLIKTETSWSPTVTLSKGIDRIIKVKSIKEKQNG